MAVAQLAPLETWTLEYVRNLPAVESEWLDFKRSEFLRTDETFSKRLSPYLSAFANYSGGYLVIGCEDPQSGQPISFDQGVDLTIKNDVRSWLEDKIPALVDPPLPSVSVHTIPLEKDFSKGLVIIRIDPSDYAPHQAQDKLFYQRVGSKLKSLSTRHILDIRDRRKHPDVDVKLTLSLWAYDDTEDPQSTLIWTIENKSDVLCKYFGLKILAPTTYGDWAVVYPDPHQLIGDPKRPNGMHYIVSANNVYTGPLFPRSKQRGYIKVKFPRQWNPPHKTIEAFEVTAYADAAPPKHFKLSQEEVVNLREEHPRM